MKVSNVFKRVKEYGLWHCLRRLWMGSCDRWQEWRLGITTSGIVDWRELGLGEECESYEPIDYSSFASVLRHIPIRPDDVFLDYGCGMGRAIILAGRRPCRRVIGVELSPKLCDIAKTNLQIVQRRLACGTVLVINADATNFAVPEDVSVVWLFNPFFGDVLNKVVARICDSLQAAPRPITIIHVFPDRVTSPFCESDWLAKTGELRVGVWKQMTCLIFQNSARISFMRA